MNIVENPSRRRILRGRFSAPTPKIRLPYIVSEQHFLGACTQCNKCYAVCETQVIAKDTLGFPFIDFSRDECNLCGKCIQICDSPLFLDEESRNEHSPFNASMTIEQSCLAKSQVFCQSCQDVCEKQAIAFHYQGNAIPVPDIDMEQCNTCGACVSTCPQTAITISPKSGNHMDNLTQATKSGYERNIEYHVASFVAHAIPSHLEQVKDDIAALLGTEIHGVSEQGKIVFTVEANNQKTIARVIDQLKTHTGLFSLAPIYHQFLNEN